MLNSENYQICLKNNLDLNKWKDIMFIDRRLNIVKMAILPKFIYRFDATSIGISDGFFLETDKLILHMEIQETQNSQNNFEKEQSQRTHTT